MTQNRIIAHRLLAARWPKLLFGVLVALVASACSEEPTAPGTEPAKLRLSMHAVQLEVGEDTTIVATLHDAYGYEIPVPPAGYEVVWATSAPTIATVAEGVVHAVDEGATTVSATAGSLRGASMNVEVLGPLFRGYHAAVLGRLPGATQSNAWDIGNSGEIAGWSSDGGGRAMRWTESEGLVELPGITSSRGINDAGALVGFSYNEGSGNPDAGWTAYVFVDGARTDLNGLLAESGHSTSARRINGAGTVVGRSGGQAVVWHRLDDGAYDIPTNLGLRNHRDGPVINDHGDIAFTAWGARFAGLFEPVLWRAQPDGSYGEPLFLGRPAGGSYVVNDINDAGLIVGYRWDGAIEIAVFWHPDDYSAPVDLGVGEAWGTNSHGDIVGVAGGPLYNLGGGLRRPVIWVLDGSTIVGAYDLGTPDGFESAGARAINDDGWVVGSAWGPGQVMATLWRPEP